MSTIHGTWVRGGTSKCWFFTEDEVVRFDATLDDVLVEAFGASDGRQLDGVGGGTSTTSKAAIVRPSRTPDVDVEYLFAQVAVGERRVEWASNCGNCATALGLYAVQHGLVPIGGETTCVRMYNLNTGSLLEAIVDTPGAEVPHFGSVTVPGTTAHGVGVRLVFNSPAGGTTGALLPTGSSVDEVDGVSMSLVDAGAPTALIASQDLPGGIDRALPDLIYLRRRAAIAMGLATEVDPVSDAVPKIGLVGPPVDYTTVQGQAVAASEHDLTVSMVSMLAPHPAIGLTSAVAVAAAGTVPSTVVDRAADDRPRSDSLRIGTPSGVVRTDVMTDPLGNIAAVSLHRAARRLSEAQIYLPFTARRAARDARTVAESGAPA